MCTHVVEPKCAVQERLVIAHIISLNLFFTIKLQFDIFQPSLQTEIAIDAVLLNDIEAEVIEWTFWKRILK